MAQPDQRVLVEALLLAHQFQSHHHLSKNLDTLLSAVNELFNSPVSVVTDSETQTVRVSKDSVSEHPVVQLGLGLIEAIASSGRRYMAEFERLGLLQPARGGGGRSLQDQSLVLSDISEGTRASLRRRASSIDQASRQQPLFIGRSQV